MNASFERAGGRRSGNKFFSPRLAALMVLSALAVAALSPAEAASKRKRRARPVTPPALVWHVETLDGRVVDSNRSEEPINPASVVKVATTWWALERLGPDHRFETAFHARGRLDAARGVLHGDLVVLGGGDPDFQAENAFFVASALNGLGVRRVTGALIVNRTFWSGWEGGSGRFGADAQRRALAMADRLRRDFDPSRWTKSTHRTWRAYASKNAIPPATKPTIAIAGGIRFEPDPAPTVGEALIVHRSNTLAETIRRFNCFSNNDIERIGGAIGTADELAADLATRLESHGHGVRLSSTSGLGENRLTPRQIVELMREFRAGAARAGLGVESLLPVAGCDPGTVTRFFPRLSTGEYATALAGKTGTLTATDGGISVVAGFLNTSEGELVFVVAAPRAAGKLRLARVVEERWMLDLLARHGGPRPRPCAPPLSEPMDGVDLVLLSRDANHASAGIDVSASSAGIP
jgi:D-alanyl-D-alanine carboxypeptidase/D-alanyl-D-alanine-endopeptidase (penicillin-binding protein 4)